jgi:hypothetical protein
MTLLAAGVKVHLAFGCTDMRKGIDGLAMLVQGMLRQDPFLATSFCSAVGRPTSSRSFSGMGPASAFSPSDWSKAASSGRQLARRVAP